MNRYTLAYRNNGYVPGKPPPALVDGSFLRPDVLCQLDYNTLAGTRVHVGRITLPLFELFDINGPDPWPAPCLRVFAPPLDRLGANMTHGELIVFNDAGDDLGASMTGGIICAFKSAGHRVGGPDVTSKRGMTGGEIVIHGNAGDHAGFLMRRGLIAIAGGAGKSPGFRMIAGTVVIGNGPLDHPGLEMQRGTILWFDDVESTQLASKSPSTSQSPPTPRGGPPAVIAASAMPSMLLLARRLDQLSFFGSDVKITPRIAAGSWRITDMDPLALNKGEVLQWQA